MYRVLPAGQCPELPVQAWVEDCLRALSVWAKRTDSLIQLYIASSCSFTRPSLFVLYTQDMASRICTLILVAAGLARSRAQGRVLSVQSLEAPAVVFDTNGTASAVPAYVVDFGVADSAFVGTYEGTAYQFNASHSIVLPASTESLQVRVRSSQAQQVTGAIGVIDLADACTELFHTQVTGSWEGSVGIEVKRDPDAVCTTTTPVAVTTETKATDTSNSTLASTTVPTNVTTTPLPVAMPFVTSVLARYNLAYSTVLAVMFVMVVCCGLCYNYRAKVQRGCLGCLRCIMPTRKYARPRRDSLIDPLSGRRSNADYVLDNTEEDWLPRPRNEGPAVQVVKTGNAVSFQTGTDSEEEDNVLLGLPRPSNNTPLELEPFGSSRA